MNDFSEIKIKGEIKTDEEILKRYSRDASIFEIRPKAVVFPKDAEDVKELVRWVSRQKEIDALLSLTARGSGTDMTGGAIGESIVVDFKQNLNRLVELGKDYAVAEPGMLFADFEKATLEKHLLLPSYTESRNSDTLGGMVGNNSGGEKSLKYGQTIKYIDEVSTVLADGNEYVFRELDDSELENKMRLTNFEGQIYRQMYQLIKNNYQLIKKFKPSVSKNSSGYPLWKVWDKHKFNLSKLFAGSQGTLGLITKIKFRLISPLSYSQCAVFYVKNLKQLAGLTQEALKYKPEILEVFDESTFKTAVHFLPETAKKFGSGFLSFLPETFRVLTGRAPKFVVVAEVCGATAEEAQIAARDLEESVRCRCFIKGFLPRGQAGGSKYKFLRAESFNLFKICSKGKTAAAIIDDIIVRPAQLGEFLPKLERLLKKYKLTYSFSGHLGDANFHIIFLINLSDYGQKRQLRKLAEEIYDLVLKFRGGISAEHGDGLVRAPFLEKAWGKEMLNLFTQTKNIFDSQDIFNPKKKQAVASWDLLFSLMKK